MQLGLGDTKNVSACTEMNDNHRKKTHFKKKFFFFSLHFCSSIRSFTIFVEYVPFFVVVVLCVFFSSSCFHHYYQHFGYILKILLLTATKHFVCLVHSVTLRTLNGSVIATAWLLFFFPFFPLKFSYLIFTKFIRYPEHF